MINYIRNLATRAVQWVIGNPRDPILAALLVGNENASGITVTPEFALTSSPFFAGVRLISQTLGSMPACVYRRDPDNRQAKYEAYKHPIHQLLTVAPNSAMIPQTFFEAMQCNAILYRG